jgi:signal peptidase
MTLLNLQDIAMTATTLDAQHVAPVPGARHAARRRRRRSRLHPLAVLRALGTVLLALSAVAALVGAGTVVVQRLGFAPVLSPSMVPTFGAGDLIVTRPLNASAVRVGDVLVLPLPDQSGQRYVHRVIAVQPGVTGRPVVTTKGDANAAVDPWRLTLTSSQVPQVITSVPRLGSLALHTKGSALRVPLLLLVAGGVLVAIKRALLDR